MAHNVFISYSADDTEVAEAICSTLESRGIKCWMAPRNVLPGQHWGEAIIDAISETQLVVVIISSYANASTQVLREVERAANKDVPIITFRIENVPLIKSLEYYLSSYHWLDAYTPPLEKYLLQLADAVRMLLAEKYEAEFPPGSAEETQARERGDDRDTPIAVKKRKLPVSIEKPPEPATKTTKRRWLWAGIACLSVGLVSEIIVSAMPAIKWSQWQSHPERTQLLAELYDSISWAILISLPFIISGVYCLGRWLAHSHLSRHAWLKIAATLIFFGLGLVFGLLGLFLSPTGSAPNGVPVLLNLVGVGLPFIVLGIYCLRRGTVRNET